MVTSDPSLWHTRKSSYRLNHDGEAEPRAVQIAGGDPEMMATAAKLNAENGAQIIDINMGCPAKKVCNKAAGSALLRDEGLVAEILSAVVEAVELPVTLKTRTGWCHETRNATRIARLAQDSGIAMLTLHGRTRADAYRGAAEYDSIRAVRQEIEIPLIANGDINSPEKAEQVLEYTGADAVMIGRAAQGRPWLLREIDHYLRTGKKLPAPERNEVYDILKQHVLALHQFYGELMGVRIARKHVGWYLAAEPEGKAFRKFFNQIDEAQTQLQAIDQFFANAHAA